MPWNEPGKDNSGNKDPWGGGQRGGGGSGNFDLERWLRQWLDRLGGKRPQGDGDGPSGFGFSSASIVLLVVVLAFAWLATGFYIVGPGERGVVLRFGAFAGETMPGPHWHLPYPIATVDVVDTGQIRSAQSKSVMLTKDENIVDVDVSAQYRVRNAERYLFDLRSPNKTLREAMISAIREVVGQSKMDYVVGEGRADIALRTQQIMQKTLDSYKAGLQVIKVNLQDAQPPEQVQGAFADAIKAREDEVRYRNEAEAYANSILPQARGEAARLDEQAQAYKEQVVARAEGDASRFDALLKEYLKAPKVTRERLYLDTMQGVLSSSSKVLIDTQGKGNSLLYLPLDKLGQSASNGGADGRSGATGSVLSGAPAPGTAGAAMEAERLRRDQRTRGAN
ncbi:FtsH protease activity modulator HflK [Acidihalobacter ferrooxydans]|uniref:Protein HflK n=1 Tax=Acidihalobacter ferrooxydans TaxID=1765967 RepID=A0A1P8UIC9_9GAMM|nr:FtsH protease activity modulator HflK [Acidihalobacter ferrooxydans]APZ43544.1 HflK protein [Acidihalobacter ferrooxydans]